MFKAQRTAHVMLSMALDVATLIVAFFVVWFLRAGLGEFIVNTAAFLGTDLKQMVRKSSDPSTHTYRILISPNPLVNIQKHLWVLYLSIPAWLFFMHSQRGYDPQGTRNGRQEFALCAYAGMLASKVRALLENRFHAAQEDIDFVARPALRHRIILNFEGQADGIETDALIDGLLDKHAAPAS